MKVKTKIDEELQEKLFEIKHDENFVSFIFNYCESQGNRKKLLNFILNGHMERKEVLLMASQIGIESGTVEGELEEI